MFSVDVVWIRLFALALLLLFLLLLLLVPLLSPTSKYYFLGTLRVLLVLYCCCYWFNCRMSLWFFRHCCCCVWPRYFHELIYDTATVAEPLPEIHLNHCSPLLKPSAGGDEPSGAAATTCLFPRFSTFHAVMVKKGRQSPDSEETNTTKQARAKAGKDGKPCWCSGCVYHRPPFKLGSRRGRQYCLDVNFFLRKQL